MKLFSIAVLTLCLSSIIGGGGAQNIILYQFRNFQGPQFLVHDISRCSNLEDELVENTWSIKTLGNCVRLFDGWDCKGASVEILPRSPFHYSLVYWKFHDRTRSVGPCRDACNKDVTGYEVWEQPPPQEITIFNRTNYEGMNKTVNVQGCTQIPQEFVHNLKSVNIGNASCLQFYDNENCLLESEAAKIHIETIELRKGTPSHDNILNWDFKVAQAVSQCSFKCYKKYVKESTPGIGEVVLFNHTNFTGYWEKLKLEHCVNLTDPWQESVMSIKMPNKTCVALHEGKGCTGDFKNVLVSSPNVLAENFENMAKSLQPCHIDSLDENKNISMASGINTNAMEIEPHNKTADVIYEGNWLKINLRSQFDLFEIWENITSSVKVLFKQIQFLSKMFEIAQEDSNKTLVTPERD